MVSNSKLAFLRVRRCGSRVLGMAVFLLFPALPALASSTVFTAAGSCTSAVPCSALSYFGLLTGSNDTLTVNNSTIKDSIGIVTGGKLTVTGTNTLSSGNIIDFADTVTVSKSAPCGTHNLCGGGTINGGNNGNGTTTIPYSSNNPDVSTSSSTAWAQYNSIYNWLSTTVSGYTTNTNTITNTTTLFNAEAANAKLDNGTYISIYSPGTSAAWTPGSNVTIGCGATGTSACVHGPNDLVVVLLNSTSTANDFAGQNITINANSGLTSDQVVFLVQGSVNDSKKNAAQLLAGVYFFGPNSVVTLGGASGQTVTLDGRLFGGTETLNSVTQIDAGLVPEPGTWAMMIGGIGAMVAVHCRRRRSRCH